MSIDLAVLSGSGKSQTTHKLAEKVVARETG